MGAIALVLLIIAFIVTGVRDWKKDISNYRNSGDSETYRDHKGRIRDKETGCKLRMKFDRENGGIIYVDDKTGKIIRTGQRDLTTKHLNRMKFYKNVSVEPVGFSIYEYDKRTCRGQRYKDLKTGRLYAYRCTYGRGGDVYINVNTGIIDRFDDTFYEINKRSKDNGRIYYTDDVIENMICEYNLKQVKKLKDKMLEIGGLSDLFEGYPLKDTTANVDSYYIENEQQLNDIIYNRTKCSAIERKYGLIKHKNYNLYLNLLKLRDFNSLDEVIKFVKDNFEEVK